MAASEETAVVITVEENKAKQCLNNVPEDINYGLSVKLLMQHFVDNQKLMESSPVEIAAALKKIKSADPKLEHIGKEDLYLYPQGNKIAVGFSPKRLKEIAESDDNVAHIIVQAVVKSEASKFMLKVDDKGSYIETVEGGVQAFLEEEDTSIIGVFATVKYIDGFMETIRIGQKEIESAQKAAKDLSIWNSFPIAMTEKVGLKRLFKKIKFASNGAAITSAVAVDNKENFSLKDQKRVLSEKKPTQVLKEEEIPFSQIGKYLVVTDKDINKLTDKEGKLSIMETLHFMYIESEKAWKRGRTVRAQEELVLLVRKENGDV